MYGGYTGDVRLDIVQIPYGYRTDITEPLPLNISDDGQATVLTTAVPPVVIRDSLHWLGDPV